MKFTQRNGSHQQGHYVASPRTLIFAGLFLLVFGGVGAWSFIKSLEPLTWKSMPCRVTQITPTDDAKSITPFGAKVKFIFKLDGQTYEGNKLGIPGWENSKAQIDYLLRYENQFPTGPMASHRHLLHLQEATCYLPKGNPESAVLLRPAANLGGLAFIGFAVIIGWILYQAHHHRNENSDTLGRKLMPVLALFFGTPGLLMLYYLSLPVWIELIQVKSWKEVPATVAWSEIRVTSSSRSTNYSADICYEYTADGRTWRQNQIYPGNIQGGRNASAQKLVKEFYPNAKITCFVNPDKPEQSVIFRSVGWSILLTLFPLPFIAVATITLWSFFTKKKPKKIRL